MSWRENYRAAAGRGGITDTAVSKPSIALRPRWRQRSGVPTIRARRLTALVWGVLYAAIWGVESAGVHACPHHDGALVYAAVTAHASHADCYRPPTNATRGGGHEHGDGGACTCVGPCAAGALATPLPAYPARVPVPQVHARERIPAPAHGPIPRRHPRLLSPPAHAPPQIA